MAPRPKSTDAADFDEGHFIIGFTGADIGGEFPIDIADDVWLHVISGVPGVSGSYRGRRRILHLLNTFLASARGNVRAELRHIHPMEVGPGDEFVVTLSAITIEADTGNRTWELCHVGRLEHGKVAEAWVISSSVRDPLAAQLVVLRESLSRPFLLSCSKCNEFSDVSFSELASAMFPFTLWLPRPRYSQLMRCPKCKRRAWMAIDVPALRIGAAGAAARISDLVGPR